MIYITLIGLFILLCAVAPVVVIGGIILILVFSAISILYGYDDDPPNTPIISPDGEKPWNTPTTPIINTQLNTDIINLKNELEQLNELRDIVLEKYNNDDSKKEQYLRKLITLDNKIYACEKKIISLEEKQK